MVYTDNSSFLYTATGRNSSTVAFPTWVKPATKLRYHTHSQLEATPHGCVRKTYKSSNRRTNHRTCRTAMEGK